MTDPTAVVIDLDRAKELFQRRALVAIITAQPPAAPMLLSNGDDEAPQPLNPEDRFRG